MKPRLINRRFVVVIMALCFVSATITKAQDNNPNAKQIQTSSTPSAKDDKNNKKRKGSITGKIVDEGGQPLPDAEVQLSPLSSTYSSPSISVVDGEGNFRFENVSAGSYRVSPSVPGYVPANESDLIQETSYRIGDFAFLSMTKGGVITGTVTNQEDEPMISVSVRAVRVRDANNRKVTSPERNTSYAMSDDRGIYRIFGLHAGTYLVYVGGTDNYFFGDGNNLESPAVFYPSSTYDAATEITVQAGQETGSINIRFRELIGHNISGLVTNAKAFITGSRSGVNVSLKPANGNIETDDQYLEERDGKFSFSFDSIADGEYMVRANVYLAEDGYAYSEWQKVTVKGADISGINLTIFKPSSINGRVILEENKSEKKDEACKDSRTAFLEELILLTPRDEKNESARDALSGSAAEKGNAPDESGSFIVKGLRAGKRRITLKLPNDNWFVRSIVGTPIAPSKQPQDIGRNGIVLKAGDQAKDVKVIIAEGAAKLTGKILPQQEGTRLPDNLLVYLVPAEKESADDVLRYFETTIEDDGTFSIGNIPSGRYFILVRPMKAGEEKEVYRRPVAWDELTRAKLKREAETANQTIELQPCKRINDFLLKLK